MTRPSPSPRRPFALVVIALALAVVGMHSVQAAASGPTAMPMSTPHAMSTPTAAHQHAGHGKTSVSSLHTSCPTDHCVAVRTASRLTIAGPPPVLHPPASLRPTPAVVPASSPVHRADRAPPRDGPRSVLCVWRV